MSRIRSPNYPAIGVNAAIEKIRLIHRTEGKNAVSREALARALGYGGLNGGSAMVLSALGKYGFLENTKDGEARVSDLSMRILYGEVEERTAAIAEAAYNPNVFRMMNEKWPDQPPSDESMKSFLMKESFTEAAATQVIMFYREILDVAKPNRAVRASSVDGGQQEKERVSTERTVSRDSLDALPAPLPLTDKPFTLAFDGSVLTGTISIRAVKDINRLMKVLEAQKAAFQAMQEHDDQETELSEH